MTGASSVAKIVGVTVTRGPDRTAHHQAETAARSVLRRFPWLSITSLELPGTEILLWSHGAPDAFIHRAPDGATWLVAGANTAPDWAAIRAAYERDPASVPTACEMIGIFVLVRIVRDAIELWNDWTGATKVYVWRRGSHHGLSTLEPVAVAAAEAGLTDVVASSLYALLRFGVFVGTATLYRSIRLLGPDHHGTLTSDRFVQHRMNTIRPSDARWSAGWSDVIDEWYGLLEDTFRATLAHASESTLMLSGGIDSRLIAAIGTRLGHTFHPVTYGNRVWQDGLVADRVANALGLPLEHLPIATDYLSRYTEPWCEWFGTSMCVHGMYQCPALDHLRARGISRQITTGFTGDPLEGMQIEMLMRRDGDGTLLSRFGRKGSLWTDDQIARLMPDLDVARCRDELEAELQAQYSSFSGAEYQRMWLLFQWNRVFQFSSYQPTMYEYYAGVITPFVHPDHARFTLSLPRYALEGRRTIFELIKRRFPDLARIPGTYHHASPSFEFIPASYGIPLLLSKRYLAKAALGYLLPPRWRRGPFREFAPARNTFAYDALQADGIKALYPLDRVNFGRQPWFDPRELDREVTGVLEDKDLFATARLWPIQALLHRFAER